MAVFVVALFTVGASYATVTVLPVPIADARVRMTDRLPVVLFGPAATDETETGEPFDRTVKLDASGNDVLCRFSLYVIVKLNPSDASELVEYTGAVWSAFELLVNDVFSDIASLPATSWIALFAVVPSVVGATYATVTVFPVPTGEAKVSTTVLVPEVVATEDTAMASPPFVTVNALAGAVVVERFSLYVSVICVPAVLLATEE